MSTKIKTILALAALGTAAFMVLQFGPRRSPTGLAMGSDEGCGTGVEPVDVPEAQTLALTVDGAVDNEQIVGLHAGMQPVTTIDGVIGDLLVESFADTGRPLGEDVRFALVSKERYEELNKHPAVMAFPKLGKGFVLQVAQSIIVIPNDLPLHEFIVVATEGVGAAQAMLSGHHEVELTRILMYRSLSKRIPSLGIPLWETVFNAARMTQDAKKLEGHLIAVDALDTAEGDGAAAYEILADIDPDVAAKRLEERCQCENPNQAYPVFAEALVQALAKGKGSIGEMSNNDISKFVDTIKGIHVDWKVKKEGVARKKLIENMDSEVARSDINPAAKRYIAQQSAKLHEEEANSPTLDVKERINHHRHVIELDRIAGAGDKGKPKNLRSFQEVVRLAEEVDDQEAIEEVANAFRTQHPADKVANADVLATAIRIYRSRADNAPPCVSAEWLIALSKLSCAGRGCEVQAERIERAARDAADAQDRCKDAEGE